MRQSFFDYCRQYHKEARLREWDRARNAPLTPQAVTYGSHTPVWWRCENGHEWEAVVYTRTHGSGCPFCAGKKAQAGFNDLATQYPELARQWDYTKNMRYNGLYDSLYQSYVDQLMTEQEYMTLKRRYKAEAEEAERLIEALTRSQAAEAAHTPENPFLAAFGSFRDADTLTREMAQALIQRVYVDGDSNIEIVFRYRDEYKELCTYLEGRQADA